MLLYQFHSVLCLCTFQSRNISFKRDARLLLTLWSCTTVNKSESLFLKMWKSAQQNFRTSLYILLFESVVNNLRQLGNRATDTLIHVMDYLKNQVKMVWIITYNVIKKIQCRKNDERRIPTQASSLKLNSTLTSIKLQLNDNRVSLRAH